MSEIYCLDACVLLTYFKRESGFEIIQRLLDRAEAGDITIYIAAANLTEVIYDLRHIKSKTEMDKIWLDINDLPITIIRNTNDAMIKEAARLKYTYHIPLGDVQGIAAARSVGACFVTSDHTDMKQLEEREPVSFLWLPPHPKK